MSQLDECERKMLSYMVDICSGSCTETQRIAFNRDHLEWQNDPSRSADAILNGLVKKGIVTYDRTTDVYRLSDSAHKDWNDLDRK